MNYQSQLTEQVRELLQRLREETHAGSAEQFVNDSEVIEAIVNFILKNS